MLLGNVNITTSLSQIVWRYVEISLCDQIIVLNNPIETKLFPNIILFYYNLTQRPRDEMQKS